MTDRLTEEQVREWLRLSEEATPGPWSWTHIGEKVNGYVLGTAVREDGTQVAGYIDDDCERGEDVLEYAPIGEHEAATCNYSDPEFITAARAAVPALCHALLEAWERIKQQDNDVVRAFSEKVEQTLADETARADAAEKRADELGRLITSHGHSKAVPGECCNCIELGLAAHTTPEIEPRPDHHYKRYRGPVWDERTYGCAECGVPKDKHGTPAPTPESED